VQLIRASELKKQLTEDLIIRVLESIGCTQVRISGKTIKATNPDGDNRNAICVYIDNDKYWNIEDFTRPEFESKDYRDIISFVEWVQDISFPKAIKYICQICSFDYYSDTQEEQVPAFMPWLTFVESGHKQESEDKLLPIPESVLNQFVQLPVKKWIDQGVSIQSQKDFEIGLDIMTERITIPIRDGTGELVGIKGRLLDSSKSKDDKYIYLYPCSKSKLLYGLDRNYEYIKKQNECIVVEAEKSVLKLNSMGYKNAVAIGSKTISETQAELLLRLLVPITLALDQDVSDEEIQCNVEKLQYPIATVPICIIKDKFGLLLNEKESPCDREEVWKELYQDFKEVV
jgi:DNA primase